MTLLPDILGQDATPFDFRFEDDDGVKHEVAQAVLVSNNAYLLNSGRSARVPHVPGRRRIGHSRHGERLPADPTAQVDVFLKCSHRASISAPATPRCWPGSMARRCSSMPRCGWSPDPGAARPRAAGRAPRGRPAERRTRLQDLQTAVECRARSLARPGKRAIREEEQMPTPTHQSGQNRRIIGSPTTTTSTSNGSPILQ